MSESTDVNAALTVLRAAQRHHFSMNAAADLKASLLLAAALIVLAITGPQAVHDPGQYGLIALALTSLLVAIMAVKTLMPRLLVLREPDDKMELNLLFCGHFAHLGEDEYVDKVKSMLATGEGAVEALARDVFQMGIILHQKKFRQLAHTYSVCTLGLVVSGLAAVVSRFV